MRARRPTDETARLGDAIYECDIRARVEDDHRGEYVAIDVDSGSWAIGSELLDAADSLRDKRPGAINVWLVRVGHRAVARIGGGTSRSGGRYKAL